MAWLDSSMEDKSIIQDEILKIAISRKQLRFYSIIHIIKCTEKVSPKAQSNF